MRIRKIIEIKNLNNLPHSIEIEGDIYFISRGNTKEYILLSGVCPHKGGIVRAHGDCFKCPIHNWKFDLEGKSLNVKGQELSAISLKELDGWLCTDHDALVKRNNTSKKSDTRKQDIDVKLHSHACVQIIYNGFNIVTDPWLVGAAFMGSWINYPETKIDPKSIKPDLLLITHEHSDHFHEETIQFFEKTVPIYYPDFPNGRITKKLREYGFKNLFPMLFGEQYQVAPRIRLTSYEPNSVWNDSINLIEIDSIKILNINDAGINARIAEIIGPIDILMSAFSTSASGYPATWEHLTEDRKKEHYCNAVEGVYESLNQAMKIYSAKYLLPFADFTALQHPLHEKYVRVVERPNIDEIKVKIDSGDHKVINILPGEAWNLKDESFNRIYKENERKIIYLKKSKLEYSKKYFSSEKFEKQFPSNTTITKAEVVSYFERLNDIPEAKYCENLTFRTNVLDCYEGDIIFTVNLMVMDGVVAIKESLPGIDLEMWIPQQIIGEVINKNLSWDEAHAGYWCRFTRDPDIHHQYLWRMLQAPYFVKNSNIRSRDTANNITKTSNIAKVIKTIPQAEKILRRYGLYCCICGNSIVESIEQGSKKHGLTDQEIEHMLIEINCVRPEDKLKVSF